MKSILLLIVFAAALAAQPARSDPATRRDPPTRRDSDEQQALEMALAETGNSPIEYARALENHLRKYPNTARRAEIQRVLIEAAIELKDKRRLLEYGPRVIDAGDGDPKVLDHVTRALLDTEDKANNERALLYAQKLQKALDGALEALKKEDEPARGRRMDDLENRKARAIIFEARALGNLGRFPEAVVKARLGYELYPADESAREVGRWLERSGKLEESLAFYADAFAFASASKARDREKLGSVYRQVKGSESGLGDLALAAYDRVQRQLEQRRERLRAFDPNALATQPSDFVLTGLKGEKLALASLKGKVVVMDLWATWCGPCRAQHPLYEQIKKRFKQNADVVFLSVNADEDRSLVEPFLEAQKWSKDVWFDEGVQALLRITSIPTTLILNREGAVSSRLGGYIPERFVEMLSERVEEALNTGAKP